MSVDNDIDLMDSIEACRTCGIFFLTSSNYLRPIFTAAVDDPEMMHIRLELSSWKVEINENDGYPQFICTGCIHEFQKIFNFRKSCLSIQQQLLQFYNSRTKNLGIQIKTEIDDEIEQKDFVYVDDLSDTEFNTPFNIPHDAIKEEIIEEATVPTELPTDLIGTANTNLESADHTLCNTEKIQIGSAFQLSANTNIEGGDQTLCNTEKIQIGSTFQLNSVQAGLQLGPTGDIPNLPALEEFGEEEVEDNDDATSENMVVFKCEYCNCISENKQLHRLHLNRVHEIKDMECHICGKTFQNSTSARLKFHLKWHKLNKHIKCVQCGFYCTSREVLKDHVRQIHSKDTCAICGKFVLFKKMKYHMRKHGFDTLFECTYCTKVFRSSNDVNEHIRLMHSSEKSIEIGNSAEINANISIEVFCVLCSTKFSNQSELEVHMDEQHLIEGGNNLNKPIEEYNNHVYEVKDEIPSPENHELLKSLTLNSEELSKSYCYKCHQEFLHHDELGQHLQQCQPTAIDESDTSSAFNNTYKGFDNEFSKNCEHSEGNIPTDYIGNSDYGDEPQLADERIIVANEAIDEMDIFSHITTFECAKCADTFDNVEKLRVHHDEMHSKKPNFSCDICGKEFELKFSLNRHVKKHNK